MEGAVIAALRATREVQHALSQQQEEMTMLPTRTIPAPQPLLAGGAIC